MAPIQPWVPVQSQVAYTSGDVQNAIKVESFDMASYPDFYSQTPGDNSMDPNMIPPSLPNVWLRSSDLSSAQSAEMQATFAEGPYDLFSDSVQRNLQRVESTENQFHHFPQNPSQTSRMGYGMPGIGTVQEAVNYQVISQTQHYGLPTQTPWTEEPEDDYFDVESDDEDPGMKPQIGHTASYDLGPVIAMSASKDNRGMRSMTGFLNEPNVLANYEPPYTVNPLMDPRTARVFCHFITATAPTLAVCERHPSNPPIIFSGVPVPKSQRALWTYTLPMKALKHQGLLHAMLALASLHISKLQGTSPMPSLKHYHYALRRVSNSLGNLRKKRDVATLAATLLLGYYEVTTAEHNKWNSHLSGARQLIMDIDFAGMQKRIEARRSRQEARGSTHQMYDSNGYGYGVLYAPGVSDDIPSQYERHLDENLISTLRGRQLKYNQYGQVDNDDEPSLHGPPTPHEIENFEIQSDLFWWYAKQDMYQSIVSGNCLLHVQQLCGFTIQIADCCRFSYDRWGDCPPRAPIGRLNAVYGTLDHLLLLMGRMADFMSRDLPRKIRASKKSQNTSPSQGPGISNSNSSPTTGTGQDAPTMYGYMPNPGLQGIKLPPGFDRARHERLYNEPLSSEELSLDVATREAEAEWAAIRHAYDIWLEAIGPDYAPLEPEHMTPTATPFGPALYYRSYAIACILSLYHCGRIICERIHPSMPPAAQTACGMAAPRTAGYANTIGRICAGIQPLDSTVSINPHHGAALMDSCMSLFHAGIQYRDPAQRGWTITKLRDVARLTGWQTSALIASGCEQAWLKMYAMGRGPKYERKMNVMAQDDRVAGRGRDAVSLNQPPKDNNDRRFIFRNPGTRVYWALGILGAEEDMKNMHLE